MKKYILLNNIRSLLNVGAIFRTADWAGFEKVILTWFTPIPPRKEINKTAIWAENWIDWEYFENPLEIIENLKKEWFKIITLELTPDSIDFRNFPKIEENICIVVGNEIEWVDKKIIDISDYCIELPMSGKKQSLNVATAAWILMYKFV